MKEEEMKKTKMRKMAMAWQIVVVKWNERRRYRRVISDLCILGDL